MSRVISIWLCLMPATAIASPARQAIDCTAFTTHLCDRFDAEFNAAAQLFKLPPQLFKAVAWTESRCKSRAKSRVGAMGIMQIMPGTFAFLQPYTDATDPWDPLDSIVTGAFYLTHLVHRFGGPDNVSAWVHAAVAYNGGPGAVPSPPSPHGDDWDKFSTPSTHYAERVMGAYLCLGGPIPRAN